MDEHYETDLEPATWDLYEMIQAFLQAPSYHVIFEVILILWILRLLFFTKSYRPERTVLTEKEKEDLIEEWQPEPLVPDINEDHPVLQDMQHRLIDGKIGKMVTVNGINCTNLASLNFLGMSGRSEIEQVAIKALRKYGVGSCGPRGFYGTIDVHLKLEEKLQQFMACEEAIIYSYGFATIASAIPAYSKRGDVIFADEGINFSIQKGIQASRSHVHYFKHNDMTDLERLLKIQAADDKKNPKKAKVTRRFLVVEGIYMKYGDLCPLPRLLELKEQYKVRVFIDEAVSFGTLGATGKGITEHYGIPIDDVDLIAASLENSLGSVGGFCCGKAYVIDHQRLSGLGYCFSASTPPLLSQAAITALEVLEADPGLLKRLRSNCEYVHQKLNELKGFKVIGEPLSPIQHLQLAATSPDLNDDFATLRKIVLNAQSKGVALTMAAYLPEEVFIPPPSIRVAISLELDTSDIDSAVQTIKEVAQSFL